MMKIRKVSVAAGKQSTGRRSTTASAIGNRLKKKKQRKELIDMDDIVINPNLIYAQRELWTPLNSLWSRYRVHRPRLPEEDDERRRWVDIPENSPRAMNGFLGNHNNEFLNQLNQVFSNYESRFDLPEVIVISGPSGSGKSSIMRIFVQKLCDEQSLSSSQAAKWVLMINALDYVKDLSLLWNKISKFAEPNFEKFLTSKFRLIYIDNFHYISPSSQQTFKKIFLTYIGKLRYIFLTPDPKGTVTSFFLTRAVQLRTSAIQEKEALTVLLSILNRNSIGYELEGIRAIFDIHNKFPEENPAFIGQRQATPSIQGQRKEDFSLQFLNVHPTLISLTLLLDLSQKVFLDTHYLSKENVYKVCRKALELPLLPLKASVEPLERCPICTLIPPCAHIFQQEIDEMGLERRSELPSRPKGSLICPEFRRYGRCTFFNTFGHCSLHHPKKIHQLAIPIIRCEQCTLPWPCGHCTYTSHLHSLTTMIEEIRQRIGKLRQINVPDPHPSVIKHIEHIPFWREECIRIERKYVKPAHIKLLKEIQEWKDTAYCIIPALYEQKTKLLMDTFGDLVVTDLLNYRTKESNNNNQKGNAGGKSQQPSGNKDTQSLTSGWNDSTIATEE